MARMLQDGAQAYDAPPTNLLVERPRRRIVMPDTNQPFERAMTLAALSGLKIALGPAFLLSARTASREPELGDRGDRRDGAR